jgi:putative two-component system response regulator
MLHDIGKVGIPDAILLKKGKLDKQEMSMIMNHTNLGVKALQECLENTGYDVSLLFARDIVMYHHERWDGKGYPCGLSGEDIPILARIMAIADVYDALRSERPYKQAMSHETSVAIIVSEKGSHFDPYLVDLFHKNNRMFDTISKKKVDNAFS